jgi:rhodanese-related sulfurtransferase
MLRCGSLFSAILTVFSLLLPASQACAGIGTVSLNEIEALVAEKPEDGKYLLVDARPEVKFVAGHLPWARSLPWPEMKERLAELPTDKNYRLIFYCGGLKCDLSAKAAELAIGQGYTNVSVFREGLPAWIGGGKSPWVTSGYLKMVLNDPERVALIVDARPTIKYNEGTVPGALNIPFQDWEKRKGLLPNDKNSQLIFFCGGLKCDLSDKSAARAREMGYADVRTFAYGWPDWKENSTRAFAMINPKEGGNTALSEEKAAYEGEISKGELLELMAKKPDGFVLVDVRPAEEYVKAHLPGAINILDEKIGEHCEQLKLGRQVVFYCNTGSRAAVAYYAAEDGGLKGTRFFNKDVDFTADGGYEIR